MVSSWSTDEDCSDPHRTTLEGKQGIGHTRFALIYVTRIVSMAFSELLLMSHDVITASKEPNLDLVLVQTHCKLFNAALNTV